MKDVRPWVFWIGVLSVIGAIVTRFLWRDVPEIPRPAAFLDFADTCFLLVIATALIEIVDMVRERCAPRAPKEAAEPEKPAEES